MAKTIALTYIIIFCCVLVVYVAIYLHHCRCVAGSYILYFVDMPNLKKGVKAELGINKAGFNC